MHKRPAKCFPPGTFIPTGPRLMAILQLCIAFSLLLWYLFQPFMGEYFTLRSRMLLYEYVMGTSDLVKLGDGNEEKMKRFAESFEHLPNDQKFLIMNDYHQIQQVAKRPAIRKMMDGVHVFLFDIPPFEQAWIFFSITIAILILLKVEGAKLAAWLLPIIVIAFAVDNQLTGKNYSSPDLKLFPTENLIIDEYLNEPLSTLPNIQQKQLEKGWKRYLIDHWSTNKERNENERIDEAEFNFTLNRLILLHKEPRHQWINSFHEKVHPLVLLLFLAWNTLFAWIVSRRQASTPSQLN